MEALNHSKKHKDIQNIFQANNHKTQVSLPSNHKTPIIYHAGHKSLNIQLSLVNYFALSFMVLE